MEKDGIVVIEIWSSSDEEEDESPVMMTKTMNSAMKDENKKKKIRAFGNDDDCLILDFNPFESINKLSINDNDENNQDISVIAEIGQVACRDYPHSRHLCAKFPFNRTPHSNYCEQIQAKIFFDSEDLSGQAGYLLQCYCYVCDSTAPCEFWLSTVLEHCHATEHDPKWQSLRKTTKMAPPSLQTS
ncbi:hypothetical protein BVC80_1653g3 [Macleaya cordata]|uniref:Uncharacterized protein n=1 Tax=Macleaya cordata TaxID=56857 RepID=A0A200PSQ9_MACCD|nr:hypothetical protein BVC80_1653g3 [Macleaya cordata]